MDRIIRLTLVLGLIMAIDGAGSAQATPDPKPARPDAREVLSALPLYFEANHGQVDASSRFLSRGPDHLLLLDRDGAELRLGGDETTGAGPVDSKGRLRDSVCSSRPDRARSKDASRSPGESTT